MTGMCDKAVRHDSSSLQFVLDWFVAIQQVEVCCDESEYDDDNYDKFSD